MVSVDLRTVLMRDTGPIDQIEDKIDVLHIDREDAVVICSDDDLSPSVR